MKKTLTRRGRERERVVDVSGLGQRESGGKSSGKRKSVADFLFLLKEKDSPWFLCNFLGFFLLLFIFSKQGFVFFKSFVVVFCFFFNR